MYARLTLQRNLSPSFEFEVEHNVVSKYGSRTIEYQPYIEEYQVLG
jgi:hypothetical protein